MILNYEFDNDGQIEIAMNKILEDVLDKSAQRLLEEFQEHLMSTVYNGKYGNYSYKRYFKNGGFYGGWFIDNTKKLIRSLMFDGDLLVSPSEDVTNHGYAHGNPNGVDRRDDMPSILNDFTKNISESDFGGARYLSQAGEMGYWDSFMIDIDKRVERIVTEEFAKYHISPSS